MKSVAIIVLNYNTASMTDALARYLRDDLSYGDKDVYIVDNGSDDKPSSMTHSLPVNVGFTRGMYEAYRLASAVKKYDCFWFLNSDVTISASNTLTELVDVLFSNDTYAQIAPQHNSPHAHMRQASTAAQVVPWLEPTATLIKASTIEKIGFWELECTLGWGVDYDYGYRIRQAGLQSVLTNRARVLHREHGSQPNAGDYGARAQSEMVRVLQKKYGDTWMRITSAQGMSSPTGSPLGNNIVGKLPLVICAIFRNEALYLREWLEFHSMMGAEKFYMYQNRSDDNWEEVLDPYIESGLVEVIDWPRSGATQVPAYNDCFAKQRGKNQWMAVIDIDEFLFSPKFETIPEALATLPNAWGAVAANWTIFGASGHEDYKPGLVTERFTLRPGDAHPVNTHIKSIVRTDHQPRCRGDAHYFEVWGNTYNEKGVQVTGAHTNAHTSSLLRINHYTTKSRQEYYKRIALGRVDGVGYVAKSVFDERQDQDIDDRTIQRFLPTLRSRMTNVTHGAMAVK